MEQLLKISTIPVEFKLTVNNAQLKYDQATADLEIRRDEGGLHIKSKNIKLNLDTFEARNSVVPTTMRSIEAFAKAGQKAAYKATASFAKEGQLLLSTTLGDDGLDQVIASRLEHTSEYGLGFTPSEPPEISWEAPDLTIQYEMDKLNFDWKIARGNFEFIPGNIEVSVAQKPDLLIEYVGNPIYVPPSANPKESQIDVKA